MLGRWRRHEAGSCAVLLEASMATSRNFSPGHGRRRGAGSGPDGAHFAVRPSATRTTQHGDVASLASGLSAQTGATRLDLGGVLARPTLLQTRLRPPSSGPNLIVRDDLLEILRASSARVVAVCAPAGYGKTIVLSQLAAATSRPVAWVSLDQTDNDPVQLVVERRSSISAPRSTLACSPPCSARTRPSSPGRWRQS
jgi:hypothetical protein